MKIDKKGRLRGKIVMITGAASGIGRAAAILFAREGAKLVLADIQEEGLKQTLEIVEKEGGRGSPKERMWQVKGKSKN